MRSSSIYDRLAQRRQTPEPAPEQPPQAPEAAPPCPAPAAGLLREGANGVTLAGLLVALPEAYGVRGIEVTLERNGRPLALGLKKRPAPEQLGLDQAMDSLLASLEKRHADLRIVRRAPRQLAGHPAQQVDYLYRDGQQARHGRVVGALLPLAGGPRQWLSLSTVLDPNPAELAEWLIDFDAMLDELRLA
ncbi:protein of unknown function [Pseudomonas delhiensis]|uniref:DUF1795 domain-containing protein n=1 Tax=Pseudomonas delhiensis TaxID=366289 RepID=A0A239N4K7_9PSED|nr:DcrB-related protein [Pseudomonas delhiensis]SDK89162.1 protein of unknown function [Pseudomonas delhiensis]SNT49394.1 protein of unknown function [Pseudomonas delhiensis]